MVNDDVICGNQFLIAFNDTVMKVKSVSGVLRTELILLMMIIASAVTTIMVQCIAGILFELCMTIKRAVSFALTLK